MTSDKTMDQLRHRAKLHLIQRCINVEEYLSQRWEDFERLAASLKRQKGEAKSCKLIEGLMEVQSSSVPDGFAGPLTQGNMASTDLQPRTPIFMPELDEGGPMNESNVVIDRALRVERFVLTHRKELLKIEQLLVIASWHDLALIIRHLLIAQCNSAADRADLILLVEQVKVRKSSRAIASDRYLADIKHLEQKGLEP